jgi:signal transduction histidine kinase
MTVLAWGLAGLLVSGLCGYLLGRRKQACAVAPRPRHVTNRRRRWTRSVVRLARMRADDLDEALMQLSATAAHTLRVDRASVWQVLADQQTIVCKEMFDRPTGRHETGIVVPLAAVSRYLQALDAHRTLPIRDAQHDERCAEMADNYVRPNGICSMLDVPIRLKGRLVGVLCHEVVGEQRDWTAEDEARAATLGDLAALTWEGFAHKQAEDDLRARNLELRRSQDHMAAVQAAMAEGLLITDDQHHIQGCNEAALSLLHLDATCDQPLSQVLDLPADPATLRDRLIDLDGPADAHRQLRLNRSRIAGGGWVITVRDVTSEEALNRLKSDFIAVASHELRTPITIIQGYAALLLMDDEQGLSPGRRREILNSIRLNSDRLNRLIRNVLNVAQLDADAVVTELAPVDVSRTIAETMELLGPQAHAKRIRLLARYGEGPLPMVNADSGHLLQILTNLVENAIKYSPADRSVLIEAVPAGPMLRISVTDQGIGLPPEEQAHIFSRFYRVPTALMLKERGSGLGLYIARRLAEALGGVLLVSSEAGAGSTFAFTVPLARQDAPGIAQAG